MSGSSSGVQETARQTLIDRLLDAVKQCQIRFGGKTELATDNNSSVSCLCAQWENALQFGIKSSRKLNPLKHVAGQMLLRPDGESVWWQYIKEHLSPTEIRRFNALVNVTTDVGRAHAWLRSALNEQSLEKYLHNFLGNQLLLSSYFDKEALLMDEDRSAMLPMMAAGLSSILFAINIDNSELNTSKQLPSYSTTNTQLAPVSSWQAPSPVYSTSNTVKEKKKRKKKKANVANIVSIENADSEGNSESGRVESGDEVKDSSLSGTGDKCSDTSGPSSDQLRLEYDDRTSGPVLDTLRFDNNVTGDNLRRDEPLVDLNSGVSLTPVSCTDDVAAFWTVSQDVEESPGNEANDVSSNVMSELFVPVRKDSPVSSGFTTDDDVSEDANLAIDATEAALSAAQHVHREMADFSRNYLVRTMGDGRTSPPKGSADAKEMTSGELKQAIVSMMLRKDEVEECNRSLRQLLDKEMVECATLRLQVEELKTEKSLSQESHQTTVLALSSENDLLKHQLKKYVAAVQSLRRNTPLDIGVSGASGDETFPVLAEKNPDENASKDVEIDFERKLIQVADMHGELIELNERLQKMLNIREHQLRTLRQELVNLRGPLPDDVSREGSFSIDELGPRLVPVNTRPLINIWIPSAFAQGKSSNVHHTYQVYIRIKDDEWNVYRRYSHFHEMHKKLCKQYSGVSTFKFPQKKVLGNRDAKFVETRRRQLQSYLRKLINHSLSVIPELFEDPSKSLLLKYFSFFGTSQQDAPVPIHGAVSGQYTGL